MLLCLWDFWGKNTGVDCHFPFQGNFLTQGSNPGLLHWQVNSLLPSHQGSPIICISLDKHLWKSFTHFFLKDLFGCCSILVVRCGHLQDEACGLSCPGAYGNLSSQTRNQTCIPWIARWILNHWIIREVLLIFKLACFSQVVRVLSGCLIFNRFVNTSAVMCFVF